MRLLFENYVGHIKKTPLIRDDAGEETKVCRCIIAAPSIYAEEMKILSFKWECSHPPIYEFIAVVDPNNRIQHFLLLHINVNLTASDS